MFFTLNFLGHFREAIRYHQLRPKEMYKIFYLFTFIPLHLLCNFQRVFHFDSKYMEITEDKKKTGEEMFSSLSHYSLFIFQTPEDRFKNSQLCRNISHVTFPFFNNNSHKNIIPLISNFLL